MERMTPPTNADIKREILIAKTMKEWADEYEKEMAPKRSEWLYESRQHA